METTRYLRALGRAWYLVLILFVLGGLAGYGLYKHTPPQYSATAQLIIGYAPGQLADEVSARLLASERAAALVQIAPTDPVVRAALKTVGLPNDHPQVTANGDSTSSLFSVTVVDANGTDAARIANAYQAILLPQLTALVGPLDSSVRLQVVDPAVAPAKPFKPSRNRDLGLGLVGGLLLGIVGALLLDAFKRAIADSDEAAKVSDLTVLGTVPKHAAKTPLPAHTQPRGIRAEAYRQIRTTLLNSQPPLHVIAVTSATQGEGKTSVVANVAATIRRAGHRVIVVDADLRRSKVASVFDLPPTTPGLVEAIIGTATLASVIRDSDETLPAVLPAGSLPANPSELLASSMFASILQTLREDYEYILIDTPPVLPVADALVVAPLVDAVVVVVRVGRTTPDRLRRALDGLARVQATVAGIVPNCTASLGADRYYRYGYAEAETPASDGGHRATSSVPHHSHRR